MYSSRSGSPILNIEYSEAYEDCVIGWMLDYNNINRRFTCVQIFI